MFFRMFYDNFFYRIISFLCYEIFKESDYFLYYEMDYNFGGGEWEICKEIREIRYKFINYFFIYL